MSYKKTLTRFKNKGIKAPRKKTYITFNASFVIKRYKRGTAWKRGSEWKGLRTLTIQDGASMGDEF